MRAENKAGEEGLRPLQDSPERNLGNRKGLDKDKKGHGNQVREGARETPGRTNPKPIPCDAALYADLDVPGDIYL